MSDRLSDLLKRGPESGVHFLVWADTVKSLRRCLQRDGIDEFNQRIAFQMSPDDSSLFTDSGEAAKLGPSRGLFVDVEANITQRFRPYSSFEQDASKLFQVTALTAS